MSLYKSGFADLLDKFVGYRRASGIWNESSYGVNIRLFDRFCSDNFHGEALSQEMVDIWCAKRTTETGDSCRHRTMVVRSFINYLRDRSLTDVKTANVPKSTKRTYVPHAFEYDELSRFFYECDNVISRRPTLKYSMKRIVCPAFFRLLYSSGIRTTEARFLKREDVDLVRGILSIKKSKGKNQHYVALHESMAELLKRYDQAADRIRQGRIYFFETPNGSYYSKTWVASTFRSIWEKANGNDSKPVPYDLRHHYAAENINSWKEDTFELSDKLHYLSRSMGHGQLKSTLYYYSIVPRLAETLLEKTEGGFNEIIPEVEYEEE